MHRGKYLAAAVGIFVAGVLIGGHHLSFGWHHRKSVSANLPARLNYTSVNQVYKSLKDIPEKVNIVDVFRRSDFLPEVVQEAIDIGAETVWAQLGVENDDARLAALGAGLNYAENICLRTEHERLFKGMKHG